MSYELGDVVIMLSRLDDNLFVFFGEGGVEELGRNTLLC